MLHDPLATPVCDFLAKSNSFEEPNIRRYVTYGRYARANADSRSNVLSDSVSQWPGEYLDKYKR